MTRRLGIFLHEFGVPSEIWALRQAMLLENFEPVFFAHGKREDGYAPPEGAELHIVPREVGPRSLIWYVVRRIQRRLRHGAAVLPQPADLSRIKAAIKAARVDAVLCHFSYTAITVEAALEGEIPIICHVHGRDVSEYLEFEVHRNALRRALPHFAHVVAVGAHQAPVLKALCSDIDVSVIPCGAPVSDFEPEKDKTPAEGPPRFLTLGRLSHEKGMLETLSAFETVASQMTGAQLTIVGDGPLRAELEAARDKSPFRAAIELTGMLTPDEVRVRMKEADIFTLHSQPYRASAEGFGVAITEAGAMRLPIIASRLGGIPDQVTHNVNGLLFSPGDIETQARYMLKLGQDPALRRTMGDIAREVALTFDNRLMTQKLDATICTALKRTGLKIQN